MRVKKLLAGLILGIPVAIVALWLLVVGIFWVTLMLDEDSLIPPAEEALMDVCGVDMPADSQVLYFGPDVRAIRLFKYDNHVDNTNLWMTLMEHLVTLDNWHIESVPDAQYTAAFGDAAILRPQTPFDAWSENNGHTAFFDADTGLFVWFAENRQQKKDYLRLGVEVRDVPGMWRINEYSFLYPDALCIELLRVPEEQRKQIAALPGWTCGEAVDISAVLDEYFPRLPPFTLEDGAALTLHRGNQGESAWYALLFDPESGLMLWMSVGD